MTSAESKFAGNSDLWESLDSSVAQSIQPVREEDIKPFDTDAPLPAEKTELVSLDQQIRRLLLQYQLSVGSRRLEDVAYKVWQSLLSTLYQVNRKLGRLDEQDKVLRKLVDKLSPTGRKDLAALSNLAFVSGDLGKYEESERLATESLKLIQEHEQLGKDSPQALGAMRAKILALWKQGKIADAKALISETFAIIDSMAGGKFAKYQDEEKIALDKVVVQFGE